jgi:hypothetical protein
LLPYRVVSVDTDVQMRMAIRIRGKPYFLTITRDYFKLVPKGKRKGIEMPWAVFVEDDDAVLYSDLQASIRKILSSDH